MQEGMIVWDMTGRAMTDMVTIKQVTIDRASTVSVMTPKGLISLGGTKKDMTVGDLIGRVMIGMGLIKTAITQRDMIVPVMTVKASTNSASIEMGMITLVSMRLEFTEKRVLRLVRTVMIGRVMIKMAMIEKVITQKGIIALAIIDTDLIKTGLI